MNEEQALEHLPDTYASALTLRRQGLDGTALADHLGVAYEALPSLIELAEAKLATILAANSDATPPWADHHEPWRRLFESIEEAEHD